MRIQKFSLSAVSASLAAVILLPAHPLGAQTSTDSERIEKLERAVEQLQKRNADLENEITTLKKTTSFAPIPAEGPTKKQVIYDGKTYVERSVPVEKTAADKWKLSTSITELELYGDVRLRYEYRGGQTTDDFTVLRDDWQERKRERYRLRLGLNATVLDDWFVGIRLETSTKPRSTNVTFGDDTSGSSDAASNGPFSKTNDGIFVGQAYVSYRGFPDITLTGGRMPNPLVVTRMVWDPDINPEGAAEQWKHSFSFGTIGEESPPVYAKDGKTVVTPAPSQPWLKLDLFANFAQFIYDDANPENPLGARATTTDNGVKQRVPNSDAFLLAWQVGAKLNFPKTFYFQFAPTIYNYTGNGDTFNVHFVGGDPAISNKASLAENQTGINSLLVFDLPMEFGWKIGNLPMRIFGEFAENINGDDRARAAGFPNKGDRRYAYNIGAGIGQLKKKHDWELDAWWQHTDQYALDPNLIDDDLFDARTNMQGVVAQAGYMLSGAVSVNFTYTYGWRIDDRLGTGGIGGAIGINPLDQYQLFQADLNLKF